MDASGIFVVSSLALCLLYLTQSLFSVAVKQEAVISASKDSTAAPTSSGKPIFLFHLMKVLSMYCFCSRVNKYGYKYGYKYFEK